MPRRGKQPDELASMVLGYAAAEDGWPNRTPLERKGDKVSFV